MPHRCKSHGKRVCIWCLVTTLSFPVEHFMWEKAPLLKTITAMLGL